MDSDFSLTAMILVAEDATASEQIYLNQLSSLQNTGNILDLCYQNNLMPSTPLMKQVLMPFYHRF